MEGSKLDLGQAALVASGVKAQRQLKNYVAKIDAMCQKLAVIIGTGDDVEKAKTIFNWLWATKPKRYRSRDNFTLTKVIDAQLSKLHKNVGNCLGLTVLYNVLAQRFGLAAKAIYLDNAFGRGPHVLTMLQTGNGPIDVENIFPFGFDYKGHLNNSGRIEWSNRELVADIYVSIGNDLFEQGKLKMAIQNYDEAIKLNPNHPIASLNRQIAFAESGQAKKASQRRE